nr:hypothetical protein BgiMline_002791 [Biomphalaria glabrata]
MHFTALVWLLISIPATVKSTQPPIATTTAGTLYSTIENWTGNIDEYVPPPVPPSEVNCHVEVQTTRLHGGRCVNFGTSGISNRAVLSCQAGAYFEINNKECEALQIARELQQARELARRRRINSRTSRHNTGSFTL